MGLNQMHIRICLSQWTQFISNAFMRLSLVFLWRIPIIFYPLLNAIYIYICIHKVGADLRRPQMTSSLLILSSV